MRPGFELQNHTQARSTAASESAVRLQGDKRFPDVQASYSGRHSRGTGDLSQTWQRARTSKHQGSPLTSTYTHSHTHKASIFFPLHCLRNHLLLLHLTVSYVESHNTTSPLPALLQHMSEPHSFLIIVRPVHSIKSTQLCLPMGYCENSAESVSSRSQFFCACTQKWSC